MIPKAQPVEEDPSATLVGYTLANLEEFDGSRFLIDVEIEYRGAAGATFNAARWDAATKSLFNVSSSGILSVRNIAGTSTLSQHAYGNAVDTFASWPTMDDIFDFGVANHSAFSIRLLILRDVQWYSGSGYGHYSGIYHNHVHADFWPQYGGVPPGHPI